MFVESTTVEIVAVILVELIAIIVSVFGFVEIMTTGKGDFSPFLLNSGLSMANLTAIFVAGDVLKKKVGA